jgi:hypothetical protein
MASPLRDRAPDGPLLPPRPTSVELAAAILIVAGVIGVLTALGAWLSGSTDPFLWLGVALNAGSIALGVATRIGRLWLVTLNYAAVLAFLDLLGSASSAPALMIGVTELVVVVILLLRKPWFDAVAEARASWTARDQPLTPPTARPPIR